jgi:Rrf2 family transcriptional regulator, cysteine metabolism repressor
MKLSFASSYALQAVVHMTLAKKNDPIASHYIAQARGIPDRFLLKVLKALVTAQVLTSVKGPNGGYKLARPAGEISLLDIIEAVDGPIRSDVPPSRMEKDGGLRKRLDEICNQAADMLRKYFGKIKISDIAARD